MNPFRKFLSRVAETAKKVWKWIRENLWWLKFVLIAFGALLGYHFLRSKIARLVEFIRGRQVNWHKIPGNSDQIAITDPDTGKTEVVTLPDGVSSSEVISAGKGEIGQYEVAIDHDRTDRRSADGRGDALDRTGH